MKTEDQCHECKEKVKSVYIDGSSYKFATIQDGDCGPRMIRVSTNTDRSKVLVRALTELKSGH
eukprot:4752457-Heterocapsa_arctica.AAC.1